MAYGESNGHITDDVTWSWKVKVMAPIRYGPISQNSWRCYMATIANYYR